MPPVDEENVAVEPKDAVPEAAAAATKAEAESAAAADEGAPAENAAGKEEEKTASPDAPGEGGTEGQNGGAESSEIAKDASAKPAEEATDASEKPSEEAKDASEKPSEEATDAAPAPKGEEGAPATTSAPDGEEAPAAKTDADAPSGESPAPGDASAPEATPKKKRSPAKKKTPIKYPARYPPGTLVKKAFFDEKIDKKRLFRGKVRKYDESARLYKVVYEDGDYEELRKKEVDKILDVRCLDYLGAKFLGGTKVAKRFPDPDKDGKERLFRGKVTGYDMKAKLYKITYDDGDTEELTEAEVAETLVDKGNKFPLYAKVTKVFFDGKLKEKRPFEGRVDEYDMNAKYYIVTYEDGDSEELTEKELEEIVVKKEDGKVERLPKSWKPKVKPKKKHHKFGYDSDDSDYKGGGVRSRKKQKVDDDDDAPATPVKSPGGRFAALSPSGRSPRSSRKVVKYADESDEKIERDRPEDFVAEKKKRRRTPTKSKRSPAKKKTTSQQKKSPAKKKTTSAKKKSPAKKSPAKTPRGRPGKTRRV